jgi:hypothetical protein
MRWRIFVWWGRRIGCVVVGGMWGLFEGLYKVRRVLCGEGYIERGGCLVAREMVDLRGLVWERRKGQIVHLYEMILQSL